MVELICTICGLVVGFLIGVFYGYDTALADHHEGWEEGYNFARQSDTSSFPHRGHKYDKTC